MICALVCVAVFIVINGEKAVFAQERDKTLGMLLDGVENNYNNEVRRMGLCVHL